MSAGYMRKCSGKRRHDERATAERQRRQLVYAGKARLANTNTYRCDQCQGWHVGHIGRRPRGKGKR